MPVMIDGHNLIPKVRGLNLKSADDEMQLIELLQVYARVSRKKIEVYFDGAPFGHAGRKKFGLVTAIFVRKGIQADDAIIERLRKARKSARNWVVITSDRRIQTNVRALGTQVIRSEVFASDLEDALHTAREDASPPSDVPLMGENEVSEWLELFNAGQGENNSEDQD